MRKLHSAPGPFRVDQLKSGDPYELSEGHPIEVMPTGSRGSRRVVAAGAALGSDPGVAEIGAETGHALSGDTLRAPDLSIGRVPDDPGWVAGAPPLAIEYADRGQDEGELKQKIAELLAAGSREVWVVRLTGARRVEVHAPGVPPVTRVPGDRLELPGVLTNPFPVEALFDVEAARRVTLTNLLNREGYADLDSVRAEGRKEGRKAGRKQGRKEGRAEALRMAVLHLFASRGLAISDEVRARVAATHDEGLLLGWLGAAATAARAEDVVLTAP